jgi:hypothetical protein
VLFTALRVLARCWPALLAWFLLGWTLRALIIRGASFLMNIDENFGMLLLPLAILAQLAAYVGMFLAVRAELRQLGHLADPDAGEAAPSAVRQWRETLLVAILPFFLLYVAWNLIRADIVDLYAASTTHDNFWTAEPGEGSITAVSITIIVVAFGLRWLLGRFAGRLPRWTSLIATYLEAVWVLVALFTLRELLAGLAGWLSTRRLFGWAVDAWADLRETFAWVGVLADGIGWAASQLGTLIGLPLAWLAFASIVYFGTLPRSRRDASERVTTVRARWSRLPVWLRRFGQTLSAGLLDRWHPVALAARLIWRAGPITVGSFLLAFAVIVAGGEWLRLLAYRLIGPQGVAWWLGASDAVEMAIGAVTAVLTVSLVAAAFDRALHSDTADDLLEDAGDAVSSAAAPAADQPTH